MDRVRKVKRPISVVFGIFARPASYADLAIHLGDNRAPRSLARKSSPYGSGHFDGIFLGSHESSGIAQDQVGVDDLSRVKPFHACLCDDTKRRMTA